MSQLTSDSTETRGLLQRAAVGDDQALGLLLTRHRPYLRNLVQLRLDPKLRTHVDPSDVLQEVELEASRRVSAFRERSSMPFRLWLRQIAFDRLLTIRRHATAGKGYVPHCTSWVAFETKRRGSESLRPWCFTGNFNRGHAHAGLGQFKKATADFDKAVELNARRFGKDVAREYVAGPRGLRNPDKALPLAQAAVAREPKDPARLNTLGVS